MLDPITPVVQKWSIAFNILLSSWDWHWNGMWDFINVLNLEVGVEVTDKIFIDYVEFKMNVWECSGWKLNAIFCLTLNFLNCDYCIKCKLYYCYFGYFFSDWGFNPGTQPLSCIPKPLFKIWRQDLTKLPQLASNLWSPCLGLRSILGYWHAPQYTVWMHLLMQVWDGCWNFVVFCEKYHFLVWNALKL